FMPAQHVPELIEAVSQLYRERELEIAMGSMPDLMLPLDYEDMVELLGNLLDNACKWASRRVRIDIAVNNSVRLIVADDGPGVAEEARAVLLQRGSRLDEQESGHGLGLAIVRDMVDDYKGSLELWRSPDLGGLEVHVQLPLRSGAAF
ncbi:MAG: ATP-binding protein, partial [Sedimenticolaceae bacterium]